MDVEARGKPRWTGIAALAAAGPVAAVAARLAVALWLAVRVPAPPRLAPPPDCHGPSADCLFSPLHAAPSVADVRARLPHPARPDLAGELAPLGPEWGAPSGSDGDASRRVWLRYVLTATITADLTQPPVARRLSGFDDAYAGWLDAAWAAESQRHVAERYLTDRATHRIATLRRASRQDRLPPRPLELGLLGGWGAAVVAAAVWRERRRRVRVDAAGVEFHGERIAWDRIDAVDWYDRAVEVRLVDGTLRRDRAVVLPSALEVAERRTRALAGRG